MTHAIYFGLHPRRSRPAPTAARKPGLLPPVFVILLVNALAQGCWLPALPSLRTAFRTQGDITPAVSRPKRPALRQPGEPEFPARPTAPYTLSLDSRTRTALDRGINEISGPPGESKGLFTGSR
jgi:hypothetical protein